MEVAAIFVAFVMVFFYIVCGEKPRYNLPLPKRAAT